MIIALTHQFVEYASQVFSIISKLPEFIFVMFLKQMADHKYVRSALARKAAAHHAYILSFVPWVVVAVHEVEVVGCSFVVV